MSLRGNGSKGQQRHHALVTDVTDVTDVADVTDDVMGSAVRGEHRHGYATGTPRQRQKQPPRQRTIAYLGTLPDEGASPQERAQFWERLLPRLNRLRLEPAAFEHLMAQLVAVVPPPTEEGAGRSKPLWGCTSREARRMEGAVRRQQARS